MTKQKDLKRRVRARMQKTGESYTAARAHLVGARLPDLPPDHEALAGQSDATMTRQTGRTWRQWTHLLDDLGATELQHPQIVRLVGPEIDAAQPNRGWWAQTITVGYERLRGLRAPGQQRSGSYQFSKSRTLPVAAADAFAAFADTARRRRWLDTALTVRKATAPKSVRITWPDGTSVAVWITAKGPDRCHVSVQHEKLPTRAAADAMKPRWQAHLDALQRLLTATSRTAPAASRARSPARPARTSARSPGTRSARRSRTPGTGD